MERFVTKKEIDLIVRHIKVLEDKVKTLEEKFSKVLAYLEKRG